MAARKKGPVFRVTGLSASQPDDELALSLKTTIDEVLTGDGDLKLTVHLDIVPSCYDEDKKVALVEFRGGDPAFLAELTDNPLKECQLETDTTDISFGRHFLASRSCTRQWLMRRRPRM
ncbi:hypothetical protein PTNB73_10126 [Pyrenophora teres f. teres]|uniref:Uncharacterized protein n=1 Tax=Pyrenophora teres f. teres TaxID=97479 RepID=A0A6S6VTP5_9PLEO|nr:hypothetical protein HRS9139_01147 [Pyrenophora teres f. teres]KAE8853110.1 hypothetical protein HRS9122_00102 [Pyrenophora teres f. teres]KAE8855469.1 hypothetical protein PTNB73_10126 [Pyrenophora teres f. teres]KAE8868652.1 hypothetical protein PTNB29_02563 [Pyrenophora teres f. teres]CAE7020782.1 hypothetical protein PTTW11_03139 [Pyrenophora teres f. teres]